MQRESTSIDFPSQADVWPKAQRQRTEEFAGFLKLMFRGWVASFHRRSTMARAVRYAPVSALAAKRLPQRRPL